MATTGQEIVDFVRQQLVEPVAGFFTNSELLNAINKGEADFFGKVRGKEGTTTGSTVAGQQVYPLPPSIVAIKKVFLNDLNADGSDNWIQLVPTNLEKLTQEHPNWLSNSVVDRGRPARYMIYDDSLYLHKTPDTTGLELKIFHKAVPDPLETLSDPVNIDDSLVDGLKAYILWRAWEKDKEPERAAVQKVVYDGYVGQGRRFYNKRSGEFRHQLDIDSTRSINKDPLGGW